MVIIHVNTVEHKGYSVFSYHSRVNERHLAAIVENEGEDFWCLNVLISDLRGE